MDMQEYDEIIRHLVRIAAHQESINTGVQTTLARMETMLAHMLRTESNGHEA